MHCTTCTYRLAITDKWCGGNKAHTVVTWFHSGSGEMVQVSQRVIRVSHLNRVHKAGHVQAGRDTQGQRQDAEPRGQLHVTAPTPTPKAVADADAESRRRKPTPKAVAESRRRRRRRRRAEPPGREGEGEVEAELEGADLEGAVARVRVRVRPDQTDRRPTRTRSHAAAPLSALTSPSSPRAQNTQHALYYLYLPTSNHRQVVRWQQSTHGGDMVPQWFR